MRNQPKPATGECHDNATLIALDLWLERNPQWARQAPLEVWQDAINAAVASVKDRGVTFCVTLDRRISELKQQLAAEMEKSYNNGRADSGKMYDLAMRDNQKLGEELRITRDEAQKECFKLHAQLSEAERKYLDMERRHIESERQLAAAQAANVSYYDFIRSYFVDGILRHTNGKSYRELAKELLANEPDTSALAAAEARQPIVDALTLEVEKLIEEGKKERASFDCSPEAYCLYKLRDRMAAALAKVGKL